MRSFSTPRGPIEVSSPERMKRAPTSLAAWIGLIEERSSIGYSRKPIFNENGETLSAMTPMQRESALKLLDIQKQSFTRGQKEDLTKQRIGTSQQILTNFATNIKILSYIFLSICLIIHSKTCCMFLFFFF